MFELMPVAGMLFTLLFVAMIGGFVLLFPISRRLGAYLEQRLEQGKGGARDEETRQLRAALRSLQAEVEKLAERQEFTESLLAQPGDPARLSPPRDVASGG